MASLCAAPGPEGLPRELTNAIRAGRVRAVNLAHPRFEELMAPLPRPEKVRVNLLALGDVGSTLLMGLRLMGGDVISSIGICDLREGGGPALGVRAEPDPAAGALRRPAAGGDRVTGAAV